MELHKLSLLEIPPYANGRFLCNLCWEKGSGQVYHCSDCHFDVHVACAATAKQQTHFSHYRHPLRLCHCSTRHKCDGCGRSIHELAFRCETCDFDMHSLCVRAPRFIVHPTHAHPLSLIRSSEYPGLCNACDKEISDFAYRCRSCNYRLHQFCATLPSRIKHPKHPRHMLKLLWKPQKTNIAFKCDQCGTDGNSWRYHCSACHFYVHPCCTNILHELPHPGPEDLRSNATSSSSLVQQNVSGPLRLTSQDVEAADRVLRFAQEIIKAALIESTENAMESCTIEEQDTCPTCLEGYGTENPKKTTSCGHHFHLACILQWMETSSCCPICRKNLSIYMM